MVPISGEWTPFEDLNDQIAHYRLWGLIPSKSKKLRPIMVVDGYFGTPEPCEVVGHQGENYAVIRLSDGFHAIHGEYLAELQPSAQQKIPTGMCFAEILSNYIVLDIETTGFSYDNDRIIEIAAIAYKYGNKLSEFHSMINPGRLIPKDVVSLTGISQENVDSAPTLEDIKDSFFQFIGDSPIVGHNALAFDIPFLSKQFSAPIENLVIDTLPMSRKAFDLLPHHNLSYLNTVLELESAGSHRALNDVETTNKLLWACLAPRRYASHVHDAFLQHRLSGGRSAHKSRKLSENPKKSMPKTAFEKVSIKSISPSCPCDDSSSPLCGKSVVFTGSLSISREDAMQMAVDAGAILKTTVSSKTGYLVVGKQDITIVGMDGMSSKEEKAHELNNSGKARIQIIDEQEFLQLIKKEGLPV